MCHRLCGLSTYGLNAHVREMGMALLYVTFTCAVQPISHLLDIDLRITAARVYSYTLIDGVVCSLINEVLTVLCD